MFSLITYPDYSMITFDENGPIGSLRERKKYFSHSRENKYMHLNEKIIFQVVWFYLLFICYLISPTGSNLIPTAIVCILIPMWARCLYPHTSWFSVIMSISMFALIRMKSIWIHTCRECSVRRKFLIWELEDNIFNSGIAWLGRNLSNIKGPWFLFIGGLWRHRNLYFTTITLGVI